LTRRRPSSPRVLVLALAATIVATTGGVAAAQMGQKAAVIDHAPGRVGYRDDARISGHLENFQAGDEVALQRKDRYAWNEVNVKPVDDEGRVRFTLTDKKRTDTYRLAHADPTGSTVTSDSVTIQVMPRLTLEPSRRDFMLGRSVTLSGVLKPVREARKVRLQHRVQGEWREIATVGAGDGTYSATFKPGRTGVRGIRARFIGDSQNASTAVARVVTVYKKAPATWYGPGFYGETTACGKRLTRKTLGVAHRTLPCGTKVDILYKGRTITVPVIDRGPYTDEDWDLTSKTAQRLGFSSTGWIGVVTGS
jgi:rare lipoprotein A